MATVTLERAATTLIFKRVPALVCETCGEEYVDEDVTRMLLVHAEGAIKGGRRSGCAVLSSGVVRRKS
ncbi:MAG: YgiT-type zinc finger protein [Pseudomonadota bacterium]|nr:YgiT-type zinc finger protein [Pseudomonadota bacterium]